MLRAGACLAITLLAVVWTVRAEEPGAAEARRLASIKDEAALRQEILAKQFRDFEQSLLRLAQRLEKSTKPQDRDQAARLKQAIDLASREGIDVRFDKLIGLLKSSKVADLKEVQDAIAESEQLARNLRELLAMLLSDKDLARLRAEKDRNQAWLNKLKELQREQQVVRAQTEAGRMDKNDLGKAQDRVTQGTSQVGKEMEQNGPNAIRKLVQGANQDQKNAGKNIGGGNNDGAARDQDRAIDQIARAIEELKKLLQQQREEEIKQLLANLQARCERMLKMQTEVYENTVRLEKAIAGNADVKPTRADETRSLQLADREGEIGKEADAALAILREEGTAVAFAEVFKQIRDDIKIVERRLNVADVGDVTQAIEQDIITSLKEMIEALKRAQDVVRIIHYGPLPPNPPAKPPDPRLVEDVAQLKMIRSLQLRVNQRTEQYARKYQGEQADAPAIRHELKNLADRQQQIHEVTKTIALGRNQ